MITSRVERDLKSGKFRFYFRRIPTYKVVEVGNCCDSHRLKGKTSVLGRYNLIIIIEQGIRSLDSKICGRHV